MGADRRVRVKKKADEKRNNKMNTHRRADKHQRMPQQRAGLTRAERLFLWVMVGLCILALVMIQPDSIDAFQRAFWLRLGAAVLALFGARVLGLCVLILCMMVLITIIGAIQFCCAKKKPRKTNAPGLSNSRQKHHSSRSVMSALTQE